MCKHCIWTSENSLWESVLFFHYSGSRDLNQVVKLGHSYLYLLNHLTSSLNIKCPHTCIVLNAIRFQYWSNNSLFTIQLAAQAFGLWSNNHMQSNDPQERRATDWEERSWVLFKADDVSSSVTKSVICDGPSGICLNYANNPRKYHLFFQSKHEKCSDPSYSVTFLQIAFDITHTACVIISLTLGTPGWPKRFLKFVYLDEFSGEWPHTFSFCWVLCGLLHHFLI